MELPEFVPTWNIIPAIRNEKRPVGQWTKYQTQKYPRSKLDDYNNCNFLVVCGKTSENLFAIDLDFKKSLDLEQVQNHFYTICGKLEKELPEISNTRVHQTPHGYHLIFSTEEPIDTKHFTNIYRKKKKKVIFTGVINTRFHECLNGIDFQGEGALIMIPPSEVSERQYRVINGEAGVKRLNKKEFKKLFDFFVLKKPKKMRSKFVDIINGRLEIEYLAASRNLKEHVYWRYMFIEAWARLGLTPEEIYPFLKLNQPAFDVEKTEDQFKTVEWQTQNALTAVTYKKYFFDGKFEGVSVEPAKKTKKKDDEKEEEDEEYEDFNKLSVKELTDRIANMTLEEFPIITLDDSRQIMIKENNHYSFKTNDMYLYIKEIIDLFSKGSYTTYKRNAEEIIKDSTLFNRKTFCTNSSIINFKNGVYDVKKEEFHQDHNGMFFYCIPHDWVEKKHGCPKFEKALGEWLIPPDKSNVIQFSDIYEMIGLCMSTHTGFKKSFLNIGPKDSGKTQFTNIVTYIIGEDNTEAIPLQRMTKDHFGTVGLQMKLLNVAGELGKSAVKNPETFKTLTGDDFKVPAEVKGGKQFKFTNFAKFWFNGNNFPEVYEVDDFAFFERFLIIFFPNIFKQTDKGFKLKYFETICTPDEIAGIIQRALKGLKRLIERKGFRPEIQQNARHLWLYESNSVYQFIQDYCEMDPLEKIKKKTFYDIFQDLAKKWVSMNKFTSQLQQFGISSRQLRDEGTPTSRSYYYTGVKLKSDIEDKYMDAQFETKKLDANEILGYIK